MKKSFEDAAAANSGKHASEVHAMHEALRGGKTQDERLAAAKAAGAAMLASVTSIRQLVDGLKTIAANGDTFIDAVEHGVE